MSDGAILTALKVWVFVSFLLIVRIAHRD